MLLTLSALLLGATQANEALPWPTESPEATVYRALLPRHPQEICDQISLKLSEPVTTLDAVVRGPSMPPWVPMRAAACLVDGHLQEGESQIAGWLADPEMLGLARLVQRRLADMREMR